MAGFGSEAAVIVSLYGHARNARRDAVEINRHRRRRLGLCVRRLRRVCRLLLAGWRLRLSGLRLCRLFLDILDGLARHLWVAFVLRFGGWRLAFLGDRNLVAF